MDKVSGHIANILRSAPVILLFGAWVVFHSVNKHEYVSFISDVTFLVALFILNDDKIQAKRDERIFKRIEQLAKRIEVLSKEDLKATKRIERKLDAKSKVHR